MNIPFVDLTRQPNVLRSKIRARIDRIILTSDFILGKEAETFEQEFAKYVGTRYAIGVASGTDAILLSLLALGIKPGDEIIVPAMTFVATVSPIVQIGAKPVIVDILLDKPLIDPDRIEQAITPRTKAIIPVHLYGFPCNMSAILGIAKRHKLFVIEDACQAHGSMYHGKKMGSFGHIGCFSFYPSKNLGAYGDGGTIVTSDETVAHKLAMLRNHGQVAKYRHEILGFNSRLDTIQATVLRQKLPYLDRWNRKRRAVAAWYDYFLKDLPVTIMKEDPKTKTNYHIYAIRSSGRDALLKFLQSKHISCGIHYPEPIHLLPPFAFLKHKRGDFPNAEKFSYSTLSLPMFPGLQKREVEHVAANIRIFFRTH